MDLEKRANKILRRQINQNTTTGLMLIGICCMFGGVLLGMKMGPMICLFGFIVGPVIGGIGIALAHKQIGELRNALQTQNIEQLGVLLEALSNRNRWGSPPLPTAQSPNTPGYVPLQNLSYALIRILPQLQPGDLVQLTRSQRVTLYKSLRERDSTLVNAILTSLVQMDDQFAIPAITELANGSWKAQEDIQLQETAQRCLDQLRANREQRQNPQILLRASDRSDSAPNTLLHAVNAPEQKTEELLRASKK